ncbi:MAG: ATP-binding protein [Cyclobacteriaceae bacterium]|nr:ATP-binding protein [Cyclobacteriaceae bacterium]
MKTIKKIAITGPESTGKSEITRQLAEHFSTSWVPEYARTYLDELHDPYQQKDLTAIAKGQLKSEALMLERANGLLFCDTELTVIKIWSEFKYGTVDPWIVSKCNENPYDLYLLMDIDLPWVFDKQREQPERRTYFFDWFLRELQLRGVNYAIVHGKGHERFKNATKVIEQFLHKPASTAIRGLFQ